MTLHGDRPAKEFNIEGYPEERLLAILRDVRPEQCTLVPDAPDAFTSEEGWHLDQAQTSLAHPSIAAIKALGCRVILFIDPDPAVVPRVREAGADGVEIYTGAYAAAFRDVKLLGGRNSTARTADQTLGIEIAVAEGRFGLSRGTREGVGDLAFRLDQSHAAAAAAGNGF